MNYTIMANESTTFLHDGMELPVEDWSQNTHSFDELTKIIRDTHDAAQTTAVKAINRMQTMRNWLYGYYIIEFEQHGKDRAEYGTQLLKRLEERVNRKGLTETLFKNSRKFYRLYPQMVENIIGVISPTVSDKLLESKDASGLCDAQMTENEHVEKSPTVSDGFRTTGQMIISRLSFSHIVEIMTVDDPLARYFYEQECIKCTWSVRELRRQISTNLYVRTGISSNPEKMLSLPFLQGKHSVNPVKFQP